MAVVRELIATFGVKTDTKGFKSADEGLRRLAKGAQALVTALVAGKVVKEIASVATETARAGDRIAKTAEKLGVTTDALQELRFAAERTGVSQQTLDLALQVFTRRSAEAAMGSGAAKDALARLGVSLRDVNGTLRPADQLLGDVAEGLRNTRDDGERLRLSFQLFDSGAASLVNTFKGGREALKRLKEEGRALGGFLDTRLIRLSETFTDTQTNQAKVIQGVRNVIAKQLLPVFIKSSRELQRFLLANKGIIRARIVSFFKSFFRIVSALRTAATAAFEAFQVWFAGLDGAQSVIVKLVLALLALVAILLLPGGIILILIGLVGLIIDDFLAWKKGGDSLFGDLVTGIKDFIAQFPELGTAIDVIRFIFSGLSKFFSNVVQFWFDLFERGFFEAMSNAIDNLLAQFEGIGDGFKNIANFVSRFLSLGNLFGDGEITGAMGAAAVAAPQIAAAAVAGGTSMVNTTRNSVSVNVQATPGMDAQELGNAIARAVGEELEVQNRTAIADLTPATGA